MIFHGFLTSCFEVCGNLCHGEGGEEEGGEILAAGGDSLAAQMVKKKICLQRKRPGFDPSVRKISWRRKWLPTPVFLQG